MRPRKWYASPSLGFFLIISWYDCFAAGISPRSSAASPFSISPLGALVCAVAGISDCPAGAGPPALDRGGFGRGVAVPLLRLPRPRPRPPPPPSNPAHAQ